MSAGGVGCCRPQPGVVWYQSNGAETRFARSRGRGRGQLGQAAAAQHCPVPAAQEQVASRASNGPSRSLKLYNHGKAQFYVYLPWANVCLAYCLKCDCNVVCSTSILNNNNISSGGGYPAPVKAEVVTNELEEEEEVGRGGAKQQPPPYHIAATRSKQAGNFYNLHHHQQQQQQQQQEEHFYENQESMMKRAQVCDDSWPHQRFCSSHCGSRIDVIVLIIGN